MSDDVVAVRRAVRGLDLVARDRRFLIAAQVRCSTGYTQGRLVGGEAKLVVLSPLGRREADALRVATPAWWAKIPQGAAKVAP